MRSFKKETQKKKKKGNTGGQQECGNKGKE